MRRDRVGVEIGVAATVRGVGVGLVQPRGARAERAVDEQVAGQPAGAGAGDQRPRVGGAAHRFTPVADDLDAVFDATNLVPVGQAADIRTRAFVHRDDAEGGRGVQRGQPGPRALFGCQPVTGGRRAPGDAHRWSAAVGGRTRVRRPDPGASRRSAVEAAAEWTSTRAR